MGEGTTVVTGNGAPSRVRELGHETSAVRRQLDELLMELDRRRHEALDWRLQLRRHGREIAIVLGGVAVAAAVAVGVSVARSRRRRTLATRLADLADRGERLRRALARVIEDPDRLAPEEPPLPSSRRRVDGAAVASFALTAARVLLPHVGAALARRRKRQGWD